MGDWKNKRGGKGITMNSLTEHALLDSMLGRWVLRGTIARRSVVHDINVDWVLAGHYIRIHETSREKNSVGQPEYEALVFIGWNENSKNYGCVWLDTTGGLSVPSIGIASPGENELPFKFKNQKGELDLTNAFRYNPIDKIWEWLIDNMDKGVPKEFARVQLARF